MLTVEWMNSFLDQLSANPSLSYEQTITFFDALIESITQKITDREEFSASEILIACIGYHVFYDLKNEKYSPPVSLPERKRGVVYSRPLNYLDIEEAKERFNSLLDDLLKKLSAHSAYNDKKTAFLWFGLIDTLQRTGKFDLDIPRYRTGYIVSDLEPLITLEQKLSLGAMNLIPPEFIHYIFYDHYGLDPQIAKDSLPLVNRYNAEEAAKMLGTSKHNLIKLCLDASLGAYITHINSGQFKIIRTVGSRYNQEIIEAFADVTYPYKYYGLIRLSKPELKTLYSEEITTNDKPSLLIRLQPSLSEVIQSLSFFIDLRAKQRITLDDLLFVEDEILVYLKNSQSILPEALTLRATTTAGNIGFVEDDIQDIVQKPLEKIPQKMSTINIQEPVFYKNSDLYEITYQDKTIRLPCSLGLNRLAYLIQNPNINIRTLELVQKFNKSNHDNQIQQSNECAEDLAEQGINSDAFHNNDFINDERAQAEYKNQLVWLENEIKQLKEKEDEAEAKGDQEQVEALKDLQLDKAKELRELLKFIQKDLNHKGKSRRHKTDSEKARSAVQQTIKNAIERITSKHLELGVYLNSTIETGHQCRYSPQLSKTYNL